MRLTILTVILSAFLMSQAFADVKQIKNYKEAFPGEAPKCILCHTDKLPKKDDGKHDMNDYGKKILAENPEPTAETYTKVGKPEAVQEGDQAAGDAKAEAVEEGQEAAADAVKDVEDKIEDKAQDIKSNVATKTEGEAGK